MTLLSHKSSVGLSSSVLECALWELEVVGSTTKGVIREMFEIRINKHFLDLDIERIVPVSSVVLLWQLTSVN